MDINNTLAERGKRYGSFEAYSKTSQQIKNVVRISPNWDGLSDDKKQALEDISDKLARILTGDPEYHDSWHDIEGYAKLIADGLDNSTSSTVQTHFEARKVAEKYQPKGHWKKGSWADADNRMLKGLYQSGSSDADIALRMNRTEKSIKNRRNDLGLMGRDGRPKKKDPSEDFLPSPEIVRGVKVEKCPPGYADGNWPDKTVGTSS